LPIVVITGICISRGLEGWNGIGTDLRMKEAS